MLLKTPRNARNLFIWMGLNLYGAMCTRGKWKFRVFAIFTIIVSLTKQVVYKNRAFLKYALRPFLTGICVAACTQFKRSIGQTCYYFDNRRLRLQRAANLNFATSVVFDKERPMVSNPWAFLETTLIYLCCSFFGSECCCGCDCGACRCGSGRACGACRCGSGRAWG
jgi:hypothetical protein